jgi:hypothetical protein
VNIRGDSYRLKDKKRPGVFTVPAPSRPPERSSEEFATGAPAESGLR